MTDLKDYGIKDIPFLKIPAIKINSKDIRANGTIFYSDFAETQIQEMIQMIRLNAFPWIFLESGGPALGNGKSAFMAHVYWALKKENKNVLWAVAKDNPRMRNLLAEIVESFVGEEKLNLIREKLVDISTKSIKKALDKGPINYGSNVIQSLNKLLNEDDDRIIYTFSTIKRRVPTQEHAELFAALINLSYTLGETKYTIFIDQFEEYVLAHESASLKRKLGHQINDLQREIGEYVTYVVSTHPRVTNELISSVPEAETFTAVDTSSVEMPHMTSDDLVNMIGLYLKFFRISGFKKDKLHPFDKKIMFYAAERTDLIPRKLIQAMRLCLVYGSIYNYDLINEEFILKYHTKVFGGLENKYKEYINKKWP